MFGRKFSLGLLFAATVLFSGCSVYSNNEQQMFLKKTFNTEDVVYYRASSDSRIWIVRTRDGKVIHVNISGTFKRGGPLEVEQQVVIFQGNQ